MNKSKGITIIEVLAALMIVLFLLFMAFYTLGNIISGATLIEKKVELIDKLDKRVNTYELDGDFDDSNSGDITFSKSGPTDKILEFTATNSSFNLSIVKRVYSDVLKGYITGTSCTAVTNGYCACTISSADRLQRCMELVGTTNQNDSRVSNCTMQYGDNNSNEAGFQCAGACSEGLNASCTDLVL